MEAIGRFDTWDPDTRSDATPMAIVECDYVSGVNVFLSEHNLKLQANFIRKTFANGILPARNVLLLNTQAFW